MDIYILAITIIGVASLGMAWSPTIARRIRVSYALLYVLLGMLIFYLLGDHLPDVDPVRSPAIAIHLTELVVLISLMGTGLKIDQQFSFRVWATPFRLVSITMVLCIGVLALLAYHFLHFSLAASLLLGAVLAPTDPVLASDVQVDPPMEGKKENVRFSLTAEAGMNDGMAFPFTWLAILVATATVQEPADLVSWFARDVVYKIIAGITCGIALGRLLAYLVFYLPEHKNFVVIKDGFVAVAATLMVYGITEMVHGYGFVAVFVTAITMRNYEANHKYHRKLHDFTDQMERILLSIVLLIFGGMLVNGILAPLTWPMALVGIGFIIVVRPISALIGMVGTGLVTRERLVISFFGIRGIGSFFYLAFALHEARFAEKRELWALVSFMVVLSLIVHGLTASTTIEKLEKDIGKNSGREDARMVKTEKDGE